MLCIVALIEALDDDKESAFSYTKDGHFYPGEEHDYDLFFAQEKHEGWVNIFKGVNSDYYVGDSHIFESKEDAIEGGKDWSGNIPVKIEWEE